MSYTQTVPNTPPQGAGVFGHSDTPTAQVTELGGQQIPGTTSTIAVQETAHDLSIWGMFWGAEFTVQAVMLMLVFASVWCWTIIIDKVMKLRNLTAQSDKFEDAFWSGGSLDVLYDRVGQSPNSPMEAVFGTAMREWRRSLAKGSLNTKELKATLQQRLERIMDVTVTREMEKLEKYTGFLATVGSTAPFVGLFGTVWGIMHSFQGIAASKSTNLAVVAPGIAEALLATALGLIAAIPAVIAYNKISTDMNRYANRLDSFSHEFLAIISHQLEEMDGR